MSLTEEELKKIAKEFIKKNTPELANQEPAIQNENYSAQKEVWCKLGIDNPSTISLSVKTFTFKKIAIAEDGAQIPIISRITVNENGKIIKATRN